MGAYKFASWAIHMIMLILFSILVGWMLREWQKSRPLTKGVLALAFFVLLGSVLAITHGNHLGETTGAH